MPTWDQTLIMDNIDLFGELETIAACPPDLTIELFDEDIIVRTCTFVVVCTRASSAMCTLLGLLVCNFLRFAS